MTTRLIDTPLLRNATTEGLISTDDITITTGSIQLDNAEAINVKRADGSAFAAISTSGDTLIISANNTRPNEVKIYTPTDAGQGVSIYNGSNKIAFFENNGDISFNDDNLVWDSTNKFVGINTSTPTGIIDGRSLAKNDGIYLYNYSATGSNHTGIYINKSNQDTIGDTATTDTTILGSINFDGNNGSNFVNGAYIQAYQNGSAGASYVPTALRVYTSDGTNAPSERLYIGESGAHYFKNANGNCELKIDASNASDAYLKLTETAATDYGGLLKYDGGGNYFVIGSIDNDVETGAIYIPRGESKIGIGTTSVPHASVGAAKVAIEGTNNSGDGPHVQFTTTTDNYPLLQFLPYTHDNVSINFDSYFSGTLWTSGDSGSNFQILKANDQLRFRYDSAKNQGNTITWKEGIVMTSAGHVGIGAAPNDIFEVSDGSSNITRFVDAGPYWLVSDGSVNALYGATTSQVFYGSLSNHEVHFRVNNSTKMKIYTDGSFVVGSPTGANKGAGTINASAVYDDNVLLTCFPLEYYNTGAIDLDKWHNISPLGHHERAESFYNKRKQYIDVEKYTEFWKKEGHLPSLFSYEEYKQNGESIGSLLQRTWEDLDLKAIHISQLLDKIDLLEKEINTLKGALK